MASKYISLTPDRVLLAHRTLTSAKDRIRASISKEAKEARKLGDRFARQRGFPISFKNATWAEADRLGKNFDAVWGMSMYKLTKNHDNSVGCEAVVFKVPAATGLRSDVELTNKLLNSNALDQQANVACSE